MIEPRKILSLTNCPLALTLVNSNYYVDKIDTGFLAWTSVIKAYVVPNNATSLPSVWERDSRPALTSMDELLSEETYLPTLAMLWSQETDARLGANADLELRLDNVLFVKSLGMFAVSFFYLVDTK